VQELREDGNDVREEGVIGMPRCGMNLVHKICRTARNRAEKYLTRRNMKLEYSGVRACVKTLKIGVETVDME